jgi:hypothetical protein
MKTNEYLSICNLLQGYIMLLKCVGFYVIVAVVMKIFFWDITPCSPLKSTDISEEHVAMLGTVIKLDSCLA